MALVLIVVFDLDSPDKVTLACVVAELEAAADGIGGAAYEGNVCFD